MATLQDPPVVGRMQAWGGRWQTLAYPLPSGAFTYEFGASKLEHMAEAFMAAEIASIPAATKWPDDDDMAERAVKRAVAMLNILSRTEVNFTPTRTPGQVPEAPQTPPPGAQ